MNTAHHIVDLVALIALCFWAFIGIGVFTLATTVNICEKFIPWVARKYRNIRLQVISRQYEDE